MNKPFDERMHDVVLETCLTHGVPGELAEKIANILASDDPNQLNLGRSPSETATVREVLPYLNSKLQKESS